MDGPDKPEDDNEIDSINAGSALAQRQSRRRLMFTPFSAAPSVRTEMVWFAPLVTTDIEPASTPASMARRMVLPLAWPEALPPTLKVRSSQLPAMRLPVEFSVARSSILLDALAQRSARPMDAPPLR